MSHADAAEPGTPDSGLTCLVLLLGFHQIAADAEQLRHDMGKHEPADIDDLVRLAKRAGARAKRARLKLDQIGRRLRHSLRTTLTAPSSWSPASATKEF